jgi:hypothetical protein
MAVPQETKNRIPYILLYHSSAYIQKSVSQYTIELPEFTHIIPIFIAALGTIVKLWNQISWPSPHEWISTQ